MQKAFVRFSNMAARIAGTPWTFAICVLLVLLWAASGPLFGFGETWQLVINTSTTIITFLMVFVIQNTQNRDSAAVHAKIDELLHAVARADEAFIGIEKMTDDDLSELLAEVKRRAERNGGKGKPRVHRKPAGRGTKA